MKELAVCDLKKVGLKGCAFFKRVIEYCWAVTFSVAKQSPELDSGFFYKRGDTGLNTAEKQNVHTNRYNSYCLKKQRSTKNI